MFLLYACGLDRNEMRNGSMKNCQAWKYYEILKRTRANAFAPSSIQRRAIILRLMFWMHTHKQPIGFSHYPTSVSLLKLERKKRNPKSFYLFFSPSCFHVIAAGAEILEWSEKPKITTMFGAPFFASWLANRINI